MRRKTQLALQASIASHNESLITNLLDITGNQTRVIKALQDQIDGLYKIVNAAPARLGRHAVWRSPQVPRAEFPPMYEGIYGGLVKTPEATFIVPVSAT